MRDFFITVGCEDDSPQLPYTHVINTVQTKGRANPNLSGIEKYENEDMRRDWYHWVCGYLLETEPIPSPSIERLWFWR